MTLGKDVNEEDVGQDVDDDVDANGLERKHQYLIL
jgi:hypothetical protein